MPGKKKNNKKVSSKNASDSCSSNGNNVSSNSSTNQSSSFSSVPSGAATAPSSSSLAEAQNATMSQERAFLTKLFESALGNDGRSVKRLVSEYTEEHPDVKAEDVLTQFKDGMKRTALHFACKSPPLPPDSGSEQDIVSLLVGSDSKWLPKSAVEALTRLKDKEGLTPLMMVAQMAGGDAAGISPERVRETAFARMKALLGSSPNGHKLALARSKAGATPLHYAASAGAPGAVIRLLFDCGKVALNTPSSQGGTPLHWASGTPASPDGGGDRSATIEALIRCGADVDMPNDTGMPPLILAAAAANDANAAALVTKGNADRGVILSGNLTVFHIAADLNLVKTLRALLEADADQPTHPPGGNQKTISQKCCEMKNTSGETPLDLAAQEGHVGCVMLLLPPGRNSEADARAYIAQRRLDKQSQLEKGNGSSNQNIDLSETAREHVQQKETNLMDQSKKVEFDAETKASSILSDMPINSSDNNSNKEMAQKHKAVGNSHFANKHYQAAIDEYTKAIEYDPTDATFYSNRSACCMSLHSSTNNDVATNSNNSQSNLLSSALSDAIIATKLNAKWSKAYYRLSVARLAFDRYEDAAMAAWEGVKLDPENDELKSLFQKCVRLGKKAHHQEKKKKEKKSAGAKDDESDDGKVNDVGAKEKSLKVGHVEEKER